MQNFVTEFIRDVAIDLNDEFDQNFERKAFFTDSWPSVKMYNSKGSMMIRTGALRNSIKYDIMGDRITWSSSLPYASIHNEGGEIRVTQKMKKYFWAMYYKANEAMTTTKKGILINSRRNIRLANEAEKWKNLALMKEGYMIKIPKRQIIGNHPEVNRRIETIWASKSENFLNYMTQILRRR
ncbi:phage virion morphogenesis protein [Sphingobacterium siyangense]|uniref:Virion morphogenesis family protein n=1 Tax=Sphingobacterium siyangense TaxID=459529 RepID=A0A562MQI9_9SPHI|nr:phage virion morphogenesis protein [Sphingobacterium siyangense]TWI22184.1 virion morphogenesis family protein [Sphingobacterium siyangense]